MSDALPNAAREREKERSERTQERWSALLLGIYSTSRRPASWYRKASSSPSSSSSFSYSWTKQEAKRNLLLFVDLLSSVFPIHSSVRPSIHPTNNNKNAETTYFTYYSTVISREVTTTAQRWLVIQSHKKKLRKALTRSHAPIHTYSVYCV